MEIDEENDFTLNCTTNGIDYYDLIPCLKKEEIKQLVETCRNYPILLDGLNELEENCKCHKYGHASNTVLYDINKIIISLGIAGIKKQDVN